MLDSTILRRMLQPQILLPLEDHYDRKKVVLVEHQTADSRLEVHNVPADTVVINLDSAFHNQNFFQGKSGECKRADYIFISELAQKVVFIEMKRGKALANEIEKQLRGALCAFEYCQTIAREFFDEESFLAQYQKRFVAVFGTGGFKRKTKVERTAATGSIHNTPCCPLKINGTRTIQFQQLIGKTKAV